MTSVTLLIIGFLTLSGKLLVVPLGVEACPADPDAFVAAQAAEFRQQTGETPVSFLYGCGNAPLTPIGLES